MRFNLEDLKEKERERAPIPLNEHVSLEREGLLQEGRYYVKTLHLIF